MSSLYLTGAGFIDERAHLCTTYYPSIGLASSIRYPTDVPNPERFPSGSGLSPNDIVEGSRLTPKYRLVSPNFAFHEWRTHPTGACSCIHRIWVKIENYESIGFLGRINRWKYRTEFYWHYEFKCRPRQACVTTHYADTAMNVESYNRRGEVPTSDKGILTTVGNIASIASLVIAAVAL